jgi:hypothetical protein
VDGGCGSRAHRDSTASARRLACWAWARSAAESRHSWRAFSRSRCARTCGSRVSASPFPCRTALVRGCPYAADDHDTLNAGTRPTRQPVGDVTGSPSREPQMGQASDSGMSEMRRRYAHAGSRSSHATHPLLARLRPAAPFRESLSEMPRGPRKGRSGCRSDEVHGCMWRAKGCGP